MKMASLIAFILTSQVLLAACEHGGSSQILGNDNGSEPINEQEAKDYQAAILKCYKTGGSRVVKIEGELRCF